MIFEIIKYIVALKKKKPIIREEEKKNGFRHKIA